MAVWPERPSPSSLQATPCQHRALGTGEAAGTGFRAIGVSARGLQGEIYFQELAQVMGGAGKSEIHRAGLPGLRQEELLQNFFLPRRPQILLLKPSTDWTRPTHIVGGPLFFFALFFRPHW